VKIPFLVTLIFLLNISIAKSLEIDEKLTLRFLKVSSTKKTILINRGGEDGLVVGDHAKFFITAGVVARGVAEKVSPSRSIWSLYRVVDPNEITQDKVLNLKIATPVKITEDPTKSMKEEEIPGGTETMSMPADDEQKEIVVDEADQAELESMGIETEDQRPVVKSSKEKKSSSKTSSQVELELPSTITFGTNKKDNWEIWGMVYLNSLSGKSETTTESTDTNASVFDFSAGIERYFLTSDTFWKDFSFSLFLHKRTTETGADVNLSASWTEFGLGANYHFYNNAFDLNRPVLYAAFTFGKGSESNETQVNDTTTPEDGDSTFVSFGMGAKYQLNNGFGARAILDYYSTSETYSYSDGTETERKLSGPRLQFGLSYRF